MLLLDSPDEGIDGQERVLLWVSFVFIILYSLFLPLLPAPNLAQTAVLPLESRDVSIEGRGGVLFWVSIVFVPLAVVSVIARFCCRYHYAAYFGGDDWVIAFSMVRSRSSTTTTTLDWG